MPKSVFVYVITGNHDESTWVLAVCPDDENLAQEICNHHRRKEMASIRDANPNFREQRIADIRRYSEYPDVYYPDLNNWSDERLLEGMLRTDYQYERVEITTSIETKD